MAYKVIISPHAQKEIETAIDYYKLSSNDAPLAFVKALNEAYNILASNPFFAVRYRNIRAFKLKKFPHSLYFVVIEETKKVRVLSCFHNKRNPRNRPRY